MLRWKVEEAHQLFVILQQALGDFRVLGVICPDKGIKGLLVSITIQ
jgi:hypothetical protein